MRITLGRVSVASRTAASPSPAEPTTSVSATESSRPVTPARNIGWSSTTSTRSGVMPVPRQHGLHDGAPTGPVEQLERAAELLRALAHGLEPRSVRRSTASGPRPSSVTRTTRCPSSPCTATSHWAAPECRSTLVSASCTIR